MRHPLEATLAQVGRLLPDGADRGPRLSLPREPGWVTLCELAAPAQVERQLELLCRTQTGGRRDVAAVWLLEAIVDLMTRPVVGGLLLDRRLLGVDPLSVAFRFAPDGLPAEWAVVSPRFRALESDPERWYPDVLATVAGEGELLAILRAELEEGLAPVVGALHVLGRRSRTALWRGCADVLGSGFLAVGKALGMVDAAVELGTRCLALDGPMRCPPNYRTVELRGGRRLVTRVRQGCCLNHVVEPGSTCLPCPLTPPHERLRRLELTNPHPHQEDEQWKAAPTRFVA
jgi:ferric iron reductase protein FhuF